MLIGHKRERARKIELNRNRGELKLVSCTVCNINARSGCCPLCKPTTQQQPRACPRCNSPPYQHIANVRLIGYLMKIDMMKIHSYQIYLVFVRLLGYLMKIDMIIVLIVELVLIFGYVFVGKLSK